MYKLLLKLSLISSHPYGAGDYCFQSYHVYGFIGLNNKAANFIPKLTCCLCLNEKQFYITKTLVYRSIVFSPVIVKCMEKNRGLAKPSYNELIFPVL